MVYYIIKYADKEQVKNILANFIVNNLYDNVTTLVNKDEQIIFITSLLLKDEIDQLEDIDSPFLDNTVCSYILEELGKKNEVQLFFKNCMLDIIQKLETTYSEQSLDLEPKSINEEIKNKKVNIEDEETNKKIQEININYIYAAINKNALKSKIKDIKDNKHMKEYLEKIVEKTQTKPNIYTNDFIFNSLTDYNEGLEKILNVYSLYFIRITDIINLIIEKLIQNSNLIPYSIKIISKIIQALIQKRFPLAIKVKQNSYIAKFFFNLLFFPLISNPSINILINEYIISEKTKIKLDKCKTILNTLVNGDLFEENIFTVFNLYIIEKMPKFIELFDNLVEVNLPLYIKNVINNKLPDDYEYNYIVENPQENFIYRNITFSLEQLSCLVDNLLKKDCREKLVCFGKVLEKLDDNKDLIHNLKNENVIENKKKVVRIFCYNDSITDETYKKIFKIKDYKEVHFKLKELKVIENEEKMLENDIIKIKNFFYSLLFYLHTLSDKDYKIESISTIDGFLKELKKQVGTNLTFTNVPLSWYINSLLNFIYKLPEEMKENDCEKLFQEMNKELNNSIEELKFKDLSRFFEYTKE